MLATARIGSKLKGNSIYKVCCWQITGGDSVRQQLLYSLSIRF